MRLIDADKLMDSLRGNMLIDVTTELENEIAQQPTAFDKEKVIEELTWHENALEPGVVKGLFVAINIVEKGGIE